MREMPTSMENKNLTPPDASPASAPAATGQQLTFDPRRGKKDADGPLHTRLAGATLEYQMSVCSGLLNSAEFRVLDDEGHSFVSFSSPLMVEAYCKITVAALLDEHSRSLFAAFPSVKLWARCFTFCVYQQILANSPEILDDAAWVPLPKLVKKLRRRLRRMLHGKDRLEAQGGRLVGKLLEFREAREQARRDAAKREAKKKAFADKPRREAALLAKRRVWAAEKLAFLHDQEIESQGRRMLFEIATHGAVPYSSSITEALDSTENFDSSSLDACDIDGSINEAEAQSGLPIGKILAGAAAGVAAFCAAKKLASSAGKSAVSGAIAQLTSKLDVLTSSIRQFFPGFLWKVVFAAVAIWLVRKCAGSIFSPVIRDYSIRFFVSNGSRSEAAAFSDVFHLADSEAEAQSGAVGPIPKVVASILSLCVFGKGWKLNVGALLRNFAVLPRAAEGFEAFWEWLRQALSTSLDWLLGMCGKEKLRLFKSKRADVEAVARRVDALENMWAGEAPDFGKITQECLSLYRDLSDLKQIYSGTPVEAELQRMRISVSRILTPLAGSISAKNLRQEPVFLLMRGLSGIGKTSVTNAVAHAILRLSDDSLRYAGVPEVAAQVISMGNSQYYEGYVGQACLVLDDFGAPRPDKQDKENDYVSLIRLMNIWSCPLNMATLESKGKIYFTSKLIVGTTNLTNVSFADDVLTNPEALARRITHGCELVLKDQYKDANGRLDPELSAAEEAACQGGEGLGAFPFYMWEVYRYDYVSGHRVGDPIPLEEHIKSCAARIRSNAARYEASLRALESLAEGFRREQKASGGAVPEGASEEAGQERSSAVPSPPAPTFDDSVGDVTTDDDEIEGQAGSSYSPPVVEEPFEPPLDLTESLLGRWNSKSRESLFQQRLDKARRWLKRTHPDRQADVYKTLRRNFDPQHAPMVSLLWCAYQCEKEADEASNVFEVDYLLIQLAFVHARFLERGRLPTKLESTMAYQRLSAGDCSLETLLEASRPSLLMRASYRFGEIIGKALVLLIRIATALSRLGEAVGCTHPLVNAMFVAAGMRMIYELVKYVIKAVTRFLFRGGRRDPEDVADEAETQSNRPTKPRAVPLHQQPRPAAKQSQNLAIHHSIWKDTYTLRVQVTSTICSYIGHMLAVQDDVFIFPHHYISQIKSDIEHGNYTLDDKVYVRNANQCEYQISMTVQQFLDHPRVDDSANDLSVFRMEHKCRAHGHKFAKFITEKEVDKLSGKAAVMYRSRVDDKFPDDNSRDVHHFELAEKRGLVYDGLMLERSFEYNVPTVKGDCGTAVMLRDNNRMPYAHTIVGLHVAGTPVRNNTVPSRRTGYCNIVTQELLAPLMREVAVKSGRPLVIDRCDEDLQLQVKQCGLPVVSPDLQPLAVKFQAEVKECEELPLRTQGSFLPLYELSSGNCFPPESRFKPTDLYGFIGPSPVRPAELGPVNRPGGRVYPLEHAYGSYSAPVMHVDMDLPARCMRVAMQPLLESINKYPRRILDFEEAINGNCVTGMRPIARDTSPGWPLSQVFKDGKKEIFGLDEAYDLSTKGSQMLRQRCDYIVECARKGERLAHVCSDFPKDELLPHAKVDEVRTRLISGTPLAYYVVCRQYFGAFVQAQLSEWERSGMCPGICVYKDWTRLRLALVQKGDKCFDGDFKRFDASQQPQFLYLMLDHIQSWYDDGEENHLIRHVLWMDLIHSRHLGGRGIQQLFVYQWNKSLPSGHFMTACVNSIFSMFCLVYAYARATGNPCSYWENVSSFTLGDDNITNISDAVAPVFNQCTVAQYVAEIGLEYTAGRKGAALVPYMRLEDCTFLKRRFVVDVTAAQVLCPLEVESFLYIAYFTRKSDPAEVREICIANVEFALEELSMHETDVWDRYAPQLFAMLAQLDAVPKQLRSQKAYRSLVLSRVTNYW
ncbi:RNA helicase [Rice Picorna-like virus 2]|nr:RNA helicase [Rice Picorna-like virus 2]